MNNFIHEAENIENALINDENITDINEAENIENTLPDGEFKWIMTVQDHFTKYTWLRPLKNKCGLEVAKGLMEIFGDFGAPFILQSTLKTKN
jgi:hypothetical protein